MHQKSELAGALGSGFSQPHLEVEQKLVTVKNIISANLTSLINGSQSHTISAHF